MGRQNGLYDKDRKNKLENFRDVYGNLEKKMDGIKEWIKEWRRKKGRKENDREDFNARIGEGEENNNEEGEKKSYS